MRAANDKTEEKIKKVQEETKLIQARTRASNAKVPYSVRKAHHQKEVRDDKREKEARKKGISWTPTFLTPEESE